MKRVGVSASNPLGTTERPGMERMGLMGLMRLMGMGLWVAFLSYKSYPSITGSRLVALSVFFLARPGLR